MSETLTKILHELNALSNEAAARIYSKIVVDEKVLGVNRGPLRKLAKTYMPDHELGLELWNTPILEIRLMATMILDPKKLSIQDLDALISQTQSISMIDELTLSVMEDFKDPKALYEAWLHHPDLIHQRVAWNSMIVLVHRKKISEKEADELIGLIEAHLVESEEVVRYAMNRTLVELGVNYPDYTQRCLNLGERLGVYKDVMVAKGCTSPYAPDWIHAVLRRKI